MMIIPLSAVAGGSRELLINPGFEAGENGWSNREKIPVSAIVEEAAHSGRFGLSVRDEALEDGARFFGEKLAVIPNQVLTLTFWAKAVSGDDLVAVSLTPADAEGRPLPGERGGASEVSHVDTKSADWESYTITYTVPENAGTVTLSIRSWTKATGVVFLDDFSLLTE